MSGTGMLVDRELNTRRAAGKVQSAANLTVFRPGAMTPEGRLAVAQWLRRQARMLEEHGEILTKSRFTAQYLYEVPAESPFEQVGG